MQFVFFGNFGGRIGHVNKYLICTCTCHLTLMFWAPTTCLGFVVAQHPCSDTARNQPLCDLLITLLPSNLDLMCIRDWAKFIVKLPNSCGAFLTSLATSMHHSALPARGFPCLASCSAYLLLSSVSCHKVCCSSIVTA